jgi:HD superfamily phosphohydrolase YqeK
MEKAWMDGIRQWWEALVHRHDSEDPTTKHNLSLKYHHSLRTQENAQKLAQSLALSEHEQDLASLIGLLHDSGRFPQFYHYKTFRDSASRNHALWSVQLLEEEQVLHKLKETEKQWILSAIANHNRFQLEAGLDEKSTQFCHLIRDSDKLDIFRVMCENQFILDFEPTDHISPKILQAIQNHQCALNQDVRHEADFKLLQLSWVFDIHYPWTLQQLHQSGLLQRFYQTIAPSPEADVAWEIVKDYKIKDSGCANETS